MDCDGGELPQTMVGGCDHRPATALAAVWAIIDSVQSNEDGGG